MGPSCSGNRYTHDEWQLSFSLAPVNCYPCAFIRGAALQGQHEAAGSYHDPALAKHD